MVSADRRFHSQGGLVTRIVYVSQGYPPERVGGVEVYLKGLAREMSGGHEVFVFSRGLQDNVKTGHTYVEMDGPVEVTRVDVNLRRLGEFREIYSRPCIEELFANYLDQVRPDLVHFQHFGGLSLGMIDVAREAGAPVVVTLSDHQPYCPRGQRIRNDKRVCTAINLDECLECLKPQTVGLEGRAAKLAAYLLGKSKGLDLLRTMHDDVAESFAKVSTFIMPSEFHRARMIEAGTPAYSSVVMPYGLDLSMLDGVPRRPAGEPVKRFGYLGTLIPSKGVEDVIMAFKRMKVTGCSLHVYGEAVPYHGVTDYDKRLVEMARSADVSFYGPYQPDDLPRVLSRIDAVVMPSRWYESYGITIREAFRAGRPTIVSDVGAFSEAVDHEVNGLKYPPGDVIGLAAAMDAMASDADMAQRMAEAGGPVTSVSDHAAGLIAVYNKAIEDS